MSQSIEELERRVGTHREVRQAIATLAIPDTITSLMQAADVALPRRTKPSVGTTIAALSMLAGGFSGVGLDFGRRSGGHDWSREPRPLTANGQTALDRAQAKRERVKERNGRHATA